MKRKELLVVAALLALTLALALCGCGAQQSKPEQKSATQQAAAGSPDKKLKIYTSFYPMYDFTKKIAGEAADVYNLVPVGTEPHDWEPSTQDMAHLSEADMLVVNGAGMESWVDKVADATKNGHLKVVTASNGVDLLKAEDHDADDHHDANEHHDGADDHDKHADEHHDAHDNEAAKSHDAHEDHEHHHHGTYDPHVWLSPKSAITELKNIKDALVEADPAHKDLFEANFKRYSEEFDKLDKDFAAKLASVPHKEIVVSHEAFGYLCRDYGLTQLGIAGINADQEPNPTQMAAIIEFVKAHKVSTIFTEELVSPKVAEAVAKETGAKIEVLNPLEGLSDEEIKQGKDYLSVMQDNLVKLVAALS